MLTEVDLENFRVFKSEVKFRFRPITVLIGRNSAGKSSLVKFLLMLQQSLESTDGDFLVADGPRVKLGAFNELRNSVVQGRSLRFRVTFQTSDLPDESQQRVIEASKRVKVKTDPLANVTEFSFSVDASPSDSVVRERTADVTVGGLVSYGRRQFGTHTVAVREAERVLFRELGRLRNPEVRLLRFPARSSQPQHTIARILSDRYLDPIRYEIASFRHLEAVREESTRVIVASSPPAHDVGQRGQFAMPHLQRVLASNDETAAFVRSHLAAIAGVERIRFSSGARGYVAHATAVNKTTGGKSYLADFGFGVGQCLPVIVQGAITPARHLMMVEQPEAQLHPTAQIEMGSLFAELWTKRKVMTLVETHSPQILLRLRRHIATGTLLPEEVSIAYVHHNKRGQPEVSNLDIDASGNLEKGLPMEFFGADVIESMRLGLKQDIEHE